MRGEAMLDACAGTWRVTDVRMPDGKPGYTGAVQVRRVGAVADLEWTIPGGPYFGIGLASADGHLHVACGEQRAGLGLALLSGPGSERPVRWSTPELQGAVGHGRATGANPTGLEGAHELTLELPDGTLYGRWTLLVQKVGGVYQVVWRKGQVDHWRALGLPTADGLAVSWYPDLDQLALLDYAAEGPDRLSAVWALGRHEELGSERLQRA